MAQNAPRLAKRWVAAEVRLRGTTLLAIEVYFISGLGVRGENLQILEQLYLLVKLCHKETIIAGDWQCEPAELAASGRPAWADLQ